MYPYKLSGKNNAHLNGAGKDPTIKYGDKHKIMMITFDIDSTPRCKNYDSHYISVNKFCKEVSQWH